MKIDRVRMAHWLERAGALDMIMKARARTRAPVLSILSYHSVGRPDPRYLFDPDVIDASPEQFREQIGVLTRHCTVIGMDELCASLAGRPLPPNPVLISFDDGYRSCVDVALPILEELGVPATFFIATDYVAERRLYWWDKIYYLIKSSKRERIAIEYPNLFELDLRRRDDAARQLLALVKKERGLDLDWFLNGLVEATGVEWNRELEQRLADELIMTWDDVRTLSKAGMDIQSHTRSHRVLQTLTPDRLTEELAGSRAAIEREIGRRVRTVAYPVGYSIREQPEIRLAVQDAGYEIGFTNATGVNYLWPWRKVDAFDIRRIAMERDLSMTMFRGLLAVPPLAYARGH